MLKRHAMLAAACLVALNVFAAVPPASAQSTAAERKAMQEQKKRENEEKRRVSEEQRKAKAEHDKSIAPRDYDFPQQGITFKSPLGWIDNAAAGAPPAGDTAGVATIVALDFSPPALPKPPEGVQVFKPRYTIEVVKLPAGQTLDAFVEHTNKSFTQDAAAVAVGRLKVAPAKDVTIGGLPGKLVVASTKPNDPRPETIRRVVTINGRRGYVFQLISPQILHGRAAMSAEQIERSVTFATEVAAAPTTQPPAEPFAVERPADRYELTAPAGWKLWPESGVSTTLLKVPDAKGGKASTIRVYRRSTRFDSTALDELAAWTKRQAERVAYDAPKPATIDGIEAMSIDGTSKDEAKAFKERVILFTRGTDSYAIQLSHDAAVEAEVTDALASVTSSFKFAGQAPTATRPTVADRQDAPDDDNDEDVVDVKVARRPPIDHAALAKLAEEKVGQPTAYKSDQLPLTLEYPGGWARDKDVENLEIALRLTHAGLAKRSKESTIAMITWDRQGSLIRSAKGGTELFAMMMTGGNKGQTKEVTLAGLPAFRCEASGVDAQGRRVNVVVVAADAQAYVLMATLAANDGDYEAWLPHFERYVQSIKWQ